jgi:hypothetical protein
VRLRWIMAAAALLALVGGAGPDAAAQANKPAKPSISPEAAEAVARMGQTLSAAEFAFQARTIRVYADPEGQVLHIFHAMKVTVHRPNRLLVEVSGDDGSNKLVFDGKTAVAFSAAQNKYASIAVPGGTIDAMLKEVVGRLGVDMPLADLLTDAPGKAFLSGVRSGRVVGTVTIDGVPCLHLFFTQAPGLDLELWVEKTEQALPRRLIVTYRSIPGEPNFIATFSDWNFSIHPPDSDFAFQPPPGATQVELKAPAAAAKPKGAKK